MSCEGCGSERNQIVGRHAVADLEAISETYACLEPDCGVTWNVWR